jgi:hypothetical protein
MIGFGGAVLGWGNHHVEGCGFNGCLRRRFGSVCGSRPAADRRSRGGLAAPATPGKDGRDRHLPALAFNGVAR